MFCIVAQIWEKLHEVFGRGELIREVELHEFTPGDIAETLLILYFEFTQQLAIAPADLSLSGSELREHLCTIQNLYQAMRILENSGQIATPIEES